MVRNIGCVLLALVLAFSMPTKVGTQADRINTLQIYLDSSPLTFENDIIPYQDKTGRTMVPLRAMAERLGAAVSWDKLSRTVSVTLEDLRLEFPVGSRFMIVDGRYSLTDAAASIRDGSAYVPVRPLMEALGYAVFWNPAEMRVSLMKREDGTQGRVLPAAYDARKTGRTTSVKDQGIIGACWAFSALGAMEAALMPGQSYDFSEDNMSLTHGYNVPQDSGGDFGMTMAYLARWAGPVAESADPYGDGKANGAATALRHVQEALAIPAKDYDAIKRAVQLYGGVQSGMYFNSDYIDSENLVYNRENAAYFYKGSAASNHAVVIVGWDDNYPADRFAVRPQRDGAFICKNSFGTGFGEAGYFYVSYEDNRIGTDGIAYTRIDSAANYDHINQTDKLGWVGRLGYGDGQAYFANVYRPQGRELLKAVSFYATDQGTAYSLYYVPRFEGEEDFERKIFIKNGRMAYKGYYTIDIEQRIELDGPYAIVVKIDTPGSILPVAAEYYKNVEWLGTVEIGDGEGYMSRYGASWERTEESFKSNVCLKAFTDDAR